MLGIFFVIILFIFLTWSGFVIIRTITKEQNRLVLLPVSQIVGLALYIFLLNIVSKLFHGHTGILISTLVLIFLTLFIYIKNKRGWVQLNPVDNNQRLFVFLIVVSILTISFVKMFTILPTGDSSMQWAYAASFARGNYPLMTPWQPDLLPNYHLGAYFFEGALYSLSGLSFLLIHSLFNTFLLLAGSLMVIFMLWKQHGLIINLWSLISVLIFFLSFGVIITVFPNFSSNVQIIDLSKLKDFIPAKGTAGAALVDLSGLSYLPARSLSLSLGLLILYFVKTIFKRKLFKILALSILLSIVALVEESIFIPLMVVLVLIISLSYLSFIPQIAYIANSRRLLLAISIIAMTVVISQGGFLTNIVFNREEGTTLYRIISPLSEPDFFSNIIFKNFFLTSQSPTPYVGWLVPSPWLFVLIIILYSFVKRNSVTGLIGLFSAISLMLFVMFEYKPCPDCSTRFLSFGYTALGFGILYLIVDIFKKLSWKKNLIFLSFFTIFILIPTIASDISYQYKIIREGIRNKEPQVILSLKDSIPWIKNLIPANERVIVIDIGFPSPGGSLDFQYNGIYTILGPQYTRVIRPQPGIEFFDLAFTLNPSILRQTKTNYIYIESSSIAYKQLPDIRKQELNNSQYFQALKSFDFTDGSSHRLLKVLPLFFDEKYGGKEVNEGSLNELREIIPKSSSVYLSNYGDDSKSLSFWYRMALQFALKDHNLIMNTSQTAYQVIETTFNRRNPKEGEIYNYYILPPDQKPEFSAEMIWSNILASAWRRI